MPKLNNGNLNYLLEFIRNNTEMLNSLLMEILKVEVVETFDFKIEEYNDIGDDKLFKIIYFKIKTTEDIIDAYINIIQDKEIEENIFNCWSIVYQKETKIYDLEESLNHMFLCIIKGYEHERIFYVGSKRREDFNLEIYQLEFYKYLRSKIDTSIELAEWLEYLEEDNEDILIVGIVDKKGMNNCKRQINHSL